MLLPGDPAPAFYAPAIGGNPRYGFATAAGRYVVLAFLPFDGRDTALRALAAHRALFDDNRASFFAVVGDAAGVQPVLPGIRFFLDPAGEIAALYGEPAGAWLLLDPLLRLIARAPLDEGDALLRMLAAQPPVAEGHAPVLVLPRVFEPEMCRRLVALYEHTGGTESGFMREIDGKTVVMSDPHHKRRADVTIADEALRAELRDRVQRRIVPEIARAFQFQVTRMERYIVACYDGGFFRPHRDNTTKGTAHRRFAVTINLNAGDYDGGALRFPEFGTRTYRAETGGAVVFSCSLLHEATPVTAGRRYAFLPFLYDEAGAAIREANNPYLGEGVEAYRSA